MKNEDKFFNNSIYDEQAAAFSEKQLTDPMQYQEGMEIIDSDILTRCRLPVLLTITTNTLKQTCLQPSLTASVRPMTSRPCFRLLLCLF